MAVAALSTGANAQSLQPQSMGAKTIQIPVAQPGSITPAQSASQTQNMHPQAEAEAKGYSIAFLAYHYNDICNLGLDRATIDNLANQLAVAEKQNQISQQVIDKNVADAQRIYKENPTKFCADGTQIAGVIKQVFAGQTPGQEVIPPMIKGMYLNQASQPQQ